VNRQERALYAEKSDDEDIRNARKDVPQCSDNPSFWKCLGPGLITGAADDDPSGIGTYSAAGAQFGYGLLWLVPVCIPLMIAVQEMCGRIGLVTGTGLAAVIKKHYPAWLLYAVVALLLFANLFNIYADLNVMAASTQMLFGGPAWIWLSVLAAGMCVTQILVPYRHYVRILKWLTLSLLAYVITALLPSVGNDWGQIAHDFFIPAWSWNAEFIMMVVGVLGTTISPYLFFWQASEEIEEAISEGKADASGKRLQQVSRRDMRDMRIDTSVGMIASQAISFFIIICAASMLHAQGITHIDTAQDAAKALLPLGKPAYWIFTLGILGTGLIAIPTLAGSGAYALAETFGWRSGLFRRFQRARAFYLTIAAMILIGYGLNFVQVLSPIKALFLSAVLNGVVTVPLLLILLLICNNRTIVKEQVNGRVSNLFGWLALILMGATVVCMFAGMLKGSA